MATIKRAAWSGRRVWRGLMYIFAFLCMFVPVLAFAQPLTGTFTGTSIGREVAFSHNGKARKAWAGVLTFQIDNGPEVPVFCIQLDVRVRSGNRYRSDGSVLDLPNGCQIRYLLGKYPASTAKDADEAAARQVAIWVFSDNLDPTTIQDAKIRDRAIALANEARSKPCSVQRTDAPDLTLAPPTANAAVGQVVAYTIQAGSKDAGQTVTVTVDGPAVLSDANGTNSGQQQQSVSLNGQAAATIWVLSTGAGQSTVSVALPYRLDAGTVLSQIDDSHPTQRLVMAERQELVAKAAAQGSWAGSAPAPSPVPSEQATATPPSAPPGGQATATPSPSAQATVAPSPTRRPQRSSPTEQPTSPAGIGGGTATPPSGVAGDTGQSAPTAPAGETASPQAGVPAGETALPAPTAAQLGNGQVTATPAQQASAPRPVRPHGLPRTGTPASPALGLLLAGVVVVLGGWMLRRRARRGR